MVLESSQSSEGWFQVLWSSDTEMSRNPVGLLRRRTKIVFKMNLWDSYVRLARISKNVEKIPVIKKIVFKMKLWDSYARLARVFSPFSFYNGIVFPTPADFSGPSAGILDI